MSLRTLWGFTNLQGFGHNDRHVVFLILSAATIGERIKNAIPLYASSGQTDGGAIRPLQIDTSRPQSDGRTRC
jgi:hypothetical protein